MSYTSTKRFPPVSTGHRQPLAAELRYSARCALLHGYGRIIEITFGCKYLDERGWCVDYGDLGEIKDWIWEQYDHRMLINSDDPELDALKKWHDTKMININIMDVTKGHGAGIEMSCKFIFDYVNKWIMNRTSNRCYVKAVKISEHENNSSTYIND